MHDQYPAFPPACLSAFLLARLPTRHSSAFFLCTTVACQTVRLHCSSLHSFIHYSLHLLVHQSIGSSLGSSICRSICPPSCLFVLPYAWLHVHPLFRQHSIWTSVCPSTHPHVNQSTRLHASPNIHSPTWPCTFIRPRYRARPSARVTMPVHPPAYPPVHPPAYLPTNAI